MDSKKPNRRGFLKGGAALAGLAAGGATACERPDTRDARQENRRADRLWRALPFRHLDTRARGREAFAR